MTSHQPLTPEELLRGAEHLLSGSSHLELGPLERAAALLTRQALEMCVAARLRPFGLDPTQAKFRDQLLCLQGTMANKELARETAALWASLSTFVHHLGYEVGPTGKDMEGLLSRTIRIVDELLPRAE